MSMVYITVERMEEILRRLGVKPEPRARILVEAQQRSAPAVVSNADEPLLGLATTRQLLDELRARIEVDGKLDYRTVDS